MMTKKIALLAGCILVFFTAVGCAPKNDPAPVEPGTSIPVAYWQTTSNQTALFEKQQKSLSFVYTANTHPVIEVDTMQSFQTMDGFGYTLTGGSAILLNKMEPAARTAILKEMFSTEGNGIGVSYLRLSIGASDLSDRVFSYNDLPPGETDPEMKKFSLAPDRTDLIPVLKEILTINPGIKLMGSPWSPPTWMKTNNHSVGGSLKPEFYDAYARYFVKYIQEMAAEGIRIDAVTVQNEPLHPGNNPSLLMLANEQATFIRQSLGPAFRKAGIQTKIIIYDHNADRIDYPLTVLGDAEARQYVDGTAFHLYGGSIEALSQVHQAYPDKHLYFTEQWIGAPGNFAGDVRWHVKNLIVGAPRNWCRTVLQWNLAADPNQGPHTEGGCTECLGALTISGNQVVKNPAWYIIAHASRFVSPGSVRISSTSPAGLPNVGFRTPDGKTVLIVLNDNAASQTFNIRFQGRSAVVSLEAGAVATFVW